MSRFIAGKKCADCDKVLVNIHKELNCPYCNKMLCGSCNYINEINEFQECICGSCVFVNDVLIKKCFDRCCKSCMKEFNLLNCCVSTCEGVGTENELIACSKCKYNFCVNHISFKFNGNICSYCQVDNINIVDIDTLNKRKKLRRM